MRFAEDSITVDINESPSQGPILVSRNSSSSVDNDVAITMSRNKNINGDQNGNGRSNGNVSQNGNNTGNTSVRRSLSNNGNAIQNENGIDDYPGSTILTLPSNNTNIHTDQATSSGSGIETESSVLSIPPISVSASKSHSNSNININIYVSSSNCRRIMGNNN